MAKGVSRGYIIPMNAIPPSKPDRLDSVDCLRGLVIVLMALDHTRDFFGGMRMGWPENVWMVSPGLFYTRWITHFCASTFVFLAGLGAFLSLARGMTRSKLTLFLLTRGLWLIFLEVSIVHFGWSLKWDLYQGPLQVIWAIGASMVGLAFLVWLPAWAIGLLGCLIIGGHNYFDGVNGIKLVSDFPSLAYVFGERGWFWDLLHNSNRSFKPAEGFLYFNAYPVLPWFGVMCAGYGLGPVMRLTPQWRRWSLVILGVTAVLGFLALRYYNLYGDARPWRVIPAANEFSSETRTVMSFLNCTKYPPSLLYLLMTLGPALVLLVLLEWPLPYVKHFFLTYGRVPLFFYVLHLPVIHGLARLESWWRKGGHEIALSLQGGNDLPQLYLIWALMVLLLYFPCLGYGWLKKRYGGVFKYL
jgi:uncharacterized membrane protein